MRTADQLIQWLLGEAGGQSGVELLSELAPKLRRLGVVWELGSSYFRKRDGEAVTFLDEAGATMCFASAVPTRSAVLEELAHVAQGKGEPSPDDDIRLVIGRREVEAKECLIENADTLRILPTETAETSRQLIGWRIVLEDHEGQFR